MTMQISDSASTDVSSKAIMVIRSLDAASRAIAAAETMRQTAMSNSNFFFIA
jgi:hypothetical protein